MARPSVDKVLAEAKAAWAEKVLWTPLLRECYQYALPQMNPYWTSDGESPGRYAGQQGQRKTAGLYSSVLHTDAIKLTNRIQSELFPPFQRWADLEAGAFVDQQQVTLANQQLQDITRTLFTAIQLSNFDSMAHSWTADLVVSGTAIAKVDRLDDEHPLIFDAVPQSTVALRNGPVGMVWGFYRKHHMRGDLIVATWRDAMIPEILKKAIEENPQEKYDLMEAFYYDMKAKRWYMDVILREGKKDKHRVVERTYKSSRWIAARWMVAPGEAYGRSPVMMALPDFKTLNKVKELLLRNGALAVAGAWMVRNDGVINANNVRIFPGATIPVKATGGSAGASIARLDVGGDLNLTQLIIEDMVLSIHNVMMNKALPEQNAGTPPTATEIIQRLRELQQDLGAPFGRIMSEGLTQFLQATLQILGDAGAVPLFDGNAIKLNTGTVSVKFNSPLAKSQDLRDVETAMQWFGILGNLGQEVMALNAKVEDAGEWIGNKLGVDATLIRPFPERQKLQAQVGQMAGAQMAGNMPGAAAPGVPANMPTGGDAGAGAVPGGAEPLPIAA